MTQLIPTTWRDVRQPFESLDQVSNLSTIRFELDISLLVYQPLNYITVTLDTHQLETKEYTVDDLKDVIYSCLGQQRPAFWMALPSTGVWEVLHTCTLEDLVLYYVNSQRIRPLGIANEFPRDSTPFPYRPLHTVASRLRPTVSSASLTSLTQPSGSALKICIPSGRRVRVLLVVTGILSDCMFLVFQQGDHPCTVRDGPTKRPQYMRISRLITVTYLRFFSNGIRLSPEPQRLGI